MGDDVARIEFRPQLVRERIKNAGEGQSRVEMLTSILQKCVGLLRFDAECLSCAVLYDGPTSRVPITHVCLLRSPGLEGAAKDTISWLAMGSHYVEFNAGQVQIPVFNQ